MDYKTWLYKRFDPSLYSDLDGLWGIPWNVKLARKVDDVRATMAVSLRYDYFADPELKIRHEDSDFINDMPVNMVEILVSMILACSFRFDKDLKDEPKTEKETKLLARKPDNTIVYHEKGYTAAAEAFLADTVRKAKGSKTLLSGMMKDFNRGKFRPFTKIKINCIEDMSLNDQFYIYLAHKKVLKLSKKEIDDVIFRTRNRYDNPQAQEGVYFKQFEREKDPSKNPWKYVERTKKDDK